MFLQISNWGRWGAEDQLGSVNLVTNAKRLEAAGLIRTGLSVSLSHQLIVPGDPGTGDGAIQENGVPFIHRMIGPDFSTDNYDVNYHSFLHSHLDALCHFPYRGKTYNGYASSVVNTAEGCTRLGVENLRSGIVTRGVLFDIPRLRGVPYLEPGTPVFVEDLEAWEKQMQIVVGPGDAVFLRTGRWARWKKLGPWLLSRAEAGFHPSVAAWMKSRGVAVVGSDTGNDVLPSPVDGVPDMPFHVLAINALGMVLLDNHDLEELADTASKLHRWDFFVSIAPLVVRGGTGSPVNTIAVF